MKIVEKMRILY